ncbi:hypothetical protein Ga0466249_004639 [Sporomusaceae bacterium BoRhaA]|uniref:hypothetical protein n=1 Tax=Pelorhabdus rhamnosifermentans TaxID=2772457 RepID=UPI001FE639E1|nr:hypothetical protein [Pelorhabdus rhamnosifermentans]MBU2703494.1 hypothetical protein [Pelorhabdus rhamnosifermentans]
MRYLEKYGIIWHFGLDPLEVADFLRHFKLKLIEDVGPSYYQEKFLKPLGRRLDVSEIERTAYATVI